MPEALFQKVSANRCQPVLPSKLGVSIANIFYLAIAVYFPAYCNKTPSDCSTPSPAPYRYK
ncbi:hypothetical protein L4C34_08430 [Vibrio profundum]|uniref:hypothetical protein n=1 Tax=Vibrio profundum TaxID=2910247 RepID=UPI003D0D0739